MSFFSETYRTKVTTGRGTVVAAAVTVTEGEGDGSGTTVVTGMVPADWVQPAIRLPNIRITIRGIANFFTIMSTYTH
jgi:hypothetical protein